MIILFSIAFIFSFLGSIPPGSINISIIQLAIDEKKAVAIRFALAAAIIEFPYVLIALKFEDWITSSPLIVDNINIISATVMIFLGLINVYSFYNPTSNTSLIKLNQSGFRKGLLISILNPMAIPFWIGITAYLHHVNWIDLDNINSMVIYALGVSAGTFTLLIALVYLAQKINLKVNKKAILQLVPAGVFFALGFYALFQILFTD